MDKILESVCTQVPSLVVLVLVVSQFLKDKKDSRDSSIIERRERMDRFTEIHKEHLSARSDMTVVLEKVSTSIHEMSLAINKMSVKLAP